MDIGKRKKGVVLCPRQRKAKEEKNVGCNSGRRDCALFGFGSFVHKGIWDPRIKIFLGDTLRT
ncbi:hypothetical protein Tco_0780222, partial [Tanacetum coccineum]